MSKGKNNNASVKDNQVASSTDHQTIQREEEFQNLTLPVPSSPKELALQDSVAKYIKEVMKFPTLSPEEEMELARRVKKYKDKEAALKLVTSHLRLVVKIAMEFQRKWMQNLLELIQEGNVGLLKAVQKFDPDKGIKFSYYAAFWIKAYILKFIMDKPK
jgi:RNA polymerase sigma-32 factor